MTDVATRTPIDLVRLGADHLKQHGSDTPRLDAEILVAHALHIRRLDLYLQFERPLGPEEVDTARELIRRRSHGEPVAYIVGEKEFFGRRFVVTPDVLIPRPDTETLVSAVVDWARGLGVEVPRILDLGTGSGCIAITLAAELAARVTAVDISDSALAIARTNAEINGVSDRLTLVQGSWWDGVSGPFDIVVSNPPYITDDEMQDLHRDVREYEPHGALHGGADGLDEYRAIVSGLRAVAPGLVALEVDFRRAGAVASMLSSSLTGHRVEVIPDLAGHDRVVLARS